MFDKSSDCSKTVLLACVPTETAFNSALSYFKHRTTGAIIYSTSPVDDLLRPTFIWCTQEDMANWSAPGCPELRGRRSAAIGSTESFWIGSLPEVHECSFEPLPWSW